MSLGKKDDFKLFLLSHKIKFVFVLMLSTLLRLLYLGYQSFWVDEVFTVINVQGTSLELLFRAIAQTDAHPPLYYILLWLWVRLTGLWQSVGNTISIEFVFRLPSTIFGIASLCLTYAITRKVLSKNIALLTMLFSAISSLWFIRDREARMYSLLLMLSLASFWCLLQAFEKKKFSHWLIYGFFATALLYTHYLSFFILAGQMAYALLRWRDLNRYTLAAVLPMLLYLPWLSVLFASMAGGRANSAIREDATTEFFNILSDVVILYGGFVEDIGFKVLILVLFWLTVILGLIKLWQQERRERPFAIVTTQLLLPVLLWWSLSLFGLNIMDRRYGSFFLPYLYLSFAVGIAYITQFKRLLGLIITYCIILIFSLNTFLAYSQIPNQDWRGVGLLIGQELQTDDLILSNSTFDLVALGFYLSVPEATVFMTASFSVQELPPHLLDDLLNYPRIWFISTYYPALEGRVFVTEEDHIAFWGWVNQHRDIGRIIQIGSNTYLYELLAHPD